jgi:hypothetical protein
MLSSLQPVHHLSLGHVLGQNQGKLINYKLIALLESKHPGYVHGPRYKEVDSLFRMKAGLCTFDFLTS